MEQEENPMIHTIELGLCSLEAEVCLNSEFPELDEKYQKLFQASYEGADQLATELVVIHKE